MTTNEQQTVVPIELLRKYDKPGPRYTSYPTAPIWTDQITTDDYRNALSAASEDSNKLISIYCHIPFCKTRCYYCGCNTCITRDPNKSTTYLDSLTHEIKSTAEKLKKKRDIAQLHFGGGTPTYVGNDGLARILDCMESNFNFTENVEMSIEVDPRVTTMDQMEFLASRGFNRISLGVQDFDPEVQKASGRIQEIDLVVNLLNKARELGFKGTNFDLIYGLPKQTVKSFGESLEKVIELKPDRLAIYSFAYLPNLKSNQMKINEDDLPVTEEKYKLFALAISKLTAVGYRQIGMDHFALPTDELSIARDDGRLHRNFMGYTVQQAPEMIGFGMSSIGFVDNSFFQNISKIESYKELVTSDSFAVHKGFKLSKDDLIRQYFITSLMCNFHVKFDELKNKFDVSYQDYFSSERTRLSPFMEDGFLNETDNQLEVTELGRTFVRNIAMEFDAYIKSNQKATYSRTI